MFFKKLYLTVFICVTYGSALSVNLASLLPMFLTRSVFECVYFTGPAGKWMLSGKSRMALAPIARTGTINFSRSVMHTSSWL